MSPSRRTFLALAVPSISLTSGCLNRITSNNHQFRKGGTIRTDEPLLTGTGIEPSTPYPYQYSALITGSNEAQRVRWEYFRDQDPVFAEKFAGTNFSEAFLTISGILLPESADLESLQRNFPGERMESMYEIKAQKNRSDDTIIHTAVEHWDRKGEPPSKFSVYYKF